ELARARARHATRLRDVADAVQLEVDEVVRALDAARVALGAHDPLRRAAYLGDGQVADAEGGDPAEEAVLVVDADGGRHERGVDELLPGGETPVPGDVGRAEIDGRRLHGPRPWSDRKSVV